MKNTHVKISTGEKLAFISYLSSLLAAGIPILEATDLMLEDAKGNMKIVLQSLHSSLTQGKQLYSGLSEFPKCFDLVTINLIRASEEAGTMEATLKDLKVQIKEQMEFNDRIRSAMIYPLFIILVFIAVMLMILIVVIPKISGVFSRLDVVMPLPTQMLIYMSNTLLQYPIEVIVSITAIIAILTWFIKTQRKLLYPLIFSLPVINKLINEIDLARFARNLYLLLSAGVTITTALELTENVVIQPSVSKAIKYAHQTVLEGKHLSDAFKEQRKIFSSIMIRIIETGEQTGTLDKSMQDLYEQLDYQVTNTLKTATTIIEPVMLLVVGGLVGGMMLSIIAPIYSLIGQISK